nr:hypothetical protein [Tanacetum cinerariifolium]
MDTSPFEFRFCINSKFSNKVFVIVVLDLSKVANPLYLLRDKDLFKSKDPQVVVAAAKLPILNPNEFDLWKIRIEQYFLMTDYSLWEVILNGDSPSPTRIVDGVVQIVAPTATKQRLAKKNELKARGTLLMALLDKHQLKLNIHKDAKSLMEAIEKRFGGNKETKKVQKTLLKQQYENFSGTSSESLDQIHDSLPSEWKTHTLIWKNKADLEEQSLDDLFNNLKIYEAEVKGSSPSRQNTQNIAFVSSNNTDSTNESVSAVPSVSAASSKATVSTLPNVDSLSDSVIYSFFVSQSNSSLLDNEDLKQIDSDDLEEMDLKWQMDMLTMRARRFLKRTRKNLGVNGTNTIGFDMSKVECYNCHIRGHFARKCRTQGTIGTKTLLKELFQWRLKKNLLIMHLWHMPPQVHQVLHDQIMRKSQFNILSYKTGLESVEARLVVYQKNETVFEEDTKLLKLDIMLRDNALAELIKKFKKAKKERDDLKLTLEKFQTSFKNLKLHSHESDNSVPKNPENDSESVANVVNIDSSTNKPSKYMSKTLRPDAPIIKDWISNFEDETETESVPKQREPSFVQTSKNVKTPRESVKNVKHPKQTEHLRTNN